MTLSSKLRTLAAGLREAAAEAESLEGRAWWAEYQAAHEREERDMSKTDEAAVEVVLADKLEALLTELGGYWRETPAVELVKLVMSNGDQILSALRASRSALNDFQGKRAERDRSEAALDVLENVLRHRGYPTYLAEEQLDALAAAGFVVVAISSLPQVSPGPAGPNHKETVK